MAGGARARATTRSVGPSRAAAATLLALAVLLVGALEDPAAGAGEEPTARLGQAEEGGAPGSDHDGTGGSDHDGTGAGDDEGTSAGGEVVDADVTLFWGDGCPYSAAAHDWLERFAAANPDLEVARVEVWDDEAGQAAFAATMAALDREPRTVPTFLVAGQVRVGFDEGVAAWVEATAGQAQPTGEDEGFVPLDPDDGEPGVDLGDEPTRGDADAGGKATLALAGAAGGAGLLALLLLIARRRRRQR